MSSRIVIGDPHGCLKTLKALIAQFPAGVPISISGDLIDRGPDSAGVVQYCMDSDTEVTPGNHERMMEDFYRDNPTFSDGHTIRDNIWLQNGGAKCLMSYGFKIISVGFYAVSITADDEKPLELFKKHIEYFQSLPLYRVYDNVVNNEGRKLVVSHSSINAVWKWDDARKKNQARAFEQNILWGRPDIIKNIPEIYNIFGHTPQNKGPRVKKPFANLDTGCCYGKREHREEGYGILTGMMYPEMKIFQQENIDDEILERS